MAIKPSRANVTPPPPPAPVVNADYTFAPAAEDYLFDPIRMKAANATTVAPGAAQQVLLPTAESYIQQGLSPDVAAAVAAYQADPTARMDVFIPEMGMVQLPATAAALNAVNAPYTPGNPMYESSADFVFNVDPLEFRATPQRITYLPGQEYRLIDQRTGDILGTAQSPEQLRALSAKAVEFSNEQGQKAAYALQRSDTADGGWGTIGSYYYNPPSALEEIGNAVTFFGSIAAAGLIPGMSPLQAMGVAAAPQVVGGALQGQGIGEILQNAGLAAGAAYLGQQLPGAVDGLRGATDTAQAAGGTLGSAGGVAGGLGDIVVTAARAPQIASALTAAPSLLGSASTPSAPRQPAPEPTTNAGEITVTAAPATRLDNLVTAISSGATLGDLVRQGYTEAEIAQGIDTAQSREITVEARPTTPIVPLAPPVISTAPAAPPPTSPVTEGEEVTVTGRENLPPLIPVTVTPAAIAAATTLAGSPVANTVPSQTPPTGTPPASLLDQLAKYTTLAGLAQDLLGSLAGTGGSGGGGRGTTYTPTLGAVPTFSRGAVQPFTGDYERYGFGPEWSFFAQPAVSATTTQAAPAGILPPTNLFANTATAPYTSLI